MIAAVVAVAVVAIAVVGVALVRRSTTGPSACASLPTSLVDGEGVGAIRAEDVVLHVSVSNAMSGMGATTLVLDRSGNVLAMDAWTQSGVTYRSARLDDASRAAWTACLESADFRGLSNDHTSQQGAAENGRFCAVADASDTVIAAGPATSAVKVVRVYNIDAAGNRAGGCRLERPLPLTDLGGSTEVLRTTVAASGEEAEPPDASLTPS